MQDTEVLIPLAEIAGVFVGFGALIAVRGGGASGREEVGLMRGVVSMGALTIVAALAPVTFGRYGLTDHEVWALSSALVLIGEVVTFAAFARTPEFRANWAAGIEADLTTRSRWLVFAEWAVFGLLVLASVLIPIAILLGLAPGLEAALYFTVVVLILAGAGWTLLDLVYVQRRPTTT